MTKTSKFILLVEDNLDDIELTMRAFKKANLMNDIVVARDGVEALDFLFGTGSHTNRNLSELPQVMLLDLNMPKVNGLEVLERLRSDERTRRIPVVILTSSHEDEDILKSYNLGVNSYVRKPVDFTEFVHAIQQLGLYWLVLNITHPVA